MKFSVGLFASAVVARGMIPQSAACKSINKRLLLGKDLDLVMG